ncbi:KAP family P-loop NTPase fold protein [Methanimicrococcus blatticola]|uniref:KAP-like P-loop domain-containing protein n=1 Tax=Methanimicrococcus blatticola TaxID=91560 RepID=A0A484F5N8_9EURY|nr:P-loop NTPase fold protein [Methanimicrococcus blatticola]MBZ3935930.1 KAP family NTPase [Methanimicrococcus blatticola]MCC2509457.1 KAP family NTPase [Methanimicrococcus blatticola]TDQ68336.1 KAP-like P-loop domain-containing protein [Methanimicrococcus blatticola]
MTELNSDLPIDSVEDDLLERSTFATELAETILCYTSQNSFTISLNGKWGTGKTSVINMIESEINRLNHLNLNKMSDEREYLKPIIFRFNPWIFSDENQLVTEFFKQLSSEILKSPYSKITNVANAVIKYSDILNHVPVTSNIKIGSVFKKLGVELKNYSEFKNENVKIIKQDLIEKLNNANIKLIIIIDDIDRLTNKEICIIFSLVKSIANFPHTIYLLAFDPEIVCNALRDTQLKDSGHKYLEKIVQLPVELPIMNQSILFDLLIENLRSIVDDDTKINQSKFDRLYRNGLQDLIVSFRDISRLSNSFGIKYSLLKNKVDIVDLFSITVIEISEPNVYSKLPSYKNLLCGGSNGMSLENDKRLIDVCCDKLTSNLREKDNKQKIIDILSVMFPKIKDVQANLNFYNTYDSKRSLLENEICNPDHFDKYFRLFIGKDFSSGELLNLVFESDESELEKRILEINDLGQMDLFLKHLQAIIPTSNIDSFTRIPLIFNILLKNWSKFKNDDVKLFGISIHERLKLSIRDMLDPIDDNSKFKLIMSEVNNPEVTLSVIISIMLIYEKNKTQYSDIQSFKNLEECVLKRIQKEANDGFFPNDKGILKILGYWKRTNLESYLKWKQNYEYTDFNLARLISSCVSKGTISGTSTYEVWKVYLDYIDEYYPHDEAYTRISKFVLTPDFNKFDSDLKENIAAFLINSSTDLEDITIKLISSKLAEIKNDTALLNL